MIIAAIVWLFFMSTIQLLNCGVAISEAKGSHFFVYLVLALIHGGLAVGLLLAS